MLLQKERMSELCLPKIKVRGYWKAQVNFSIEQYKKVSEYIEDVIKNPQMNKENVTTGTSLCDKSVAGLYSLNLYESGAGQDPFDDLVKKFAREIVCSERKEDYEYSICLLFCTSSINDTGQTKQRWHRDMDHLDVALPFPLIVYVPIGKISFEMGILPSKTEFEENLKISSQRRLIAKPGEIIVLRGDIAHREVANPGSICLRYRFDISKPKMIPVIFKVFSCCECGKKYNAGARVSSCEKRCRLKKQAKTSGTLSLL